MREDRTAELYLYYRGCLDAHFWLPVFFLYFNELVEVPQVLLIEAVYYASIVTLEIPSGYFSDRFGRRFTLLIATTCLVGSFSAFFFASGIESLFMGQVLLAAGLAFNSGTDTSLHYDSLAASGRRSEYAQREGIVARNGLFIGAFAALVGGLAGAYSLRIAYGLSILSALGALLAVLLMREPSRAECAHPEFLGQLKDCLSYLKKKPIAWIFSLVVLMTILNHIPYMFYQPYLKELVLGMSLESLSTPVLTGLVAAASLIIASIVASRTIEITQKFGTVTTLLSAALIQTVIIGLMAIVINPMIALIILLRAVPRALMMAPINVCLVPRIPSSKRATYLSIQSLVGRISFAAYLLMMSWITTDSTSSTWAAIQLPLIVGFGMGIGGLLLLFTLSRNLGLDQQSKDSG
ncbi:MFS transporter [bacterium]|nr:MFS transporter [bacterium]